ncbi:type IX secretion system membrane protein PorP/SprF [Cytophagaceae bacterium ABcell3]|nr:type IX secretion system membrane protein PorP/SprF [Cytophagaceae bacterium ABcell3]
MNKLRFLFLLLLPFSVEAQQVPMFSQYLWNHYLINPAVGGAENFMEAKAGHRNQWTGLPGAPRSIYMTGHSQIGKKTINRESVDVVPSEDGEYKEPGRLGRLLGYKRRENATVPSGYKVKPHHGVGGMVMLDQAGLYSNASVHASYAYHIPLTPKVYASMGAFIGVRQHRMDWSRAVLEEDGDMAIAYNNNMHGLVPDAMVGMMVYGERFYTGFSINQLLAGEAAFGNQVQPHVTGVYNMERHYFFTGGYRMRISDEVALVPSTLVRFFPGTVPAVDLTVKANYMDLLWGGVSYRTADAVVFLIGFTYADRFDFGYSYDISMLDGNRYHRPNSHEIMLGLRIINRKYGNARPSFVW